MINDYSEAENSMLALCDALKELADLLTTNDELHWSSSIKESLSLIEAQDHRGIDLVLLCFGGMGSLNDLVINQSNNPEISESEVLSVNKHLRDLRTLVYDLANNLSRYHKLNS